MKTVMLLEGGSYRGIYTSGVLDVLMEEDLYPDCVVGISAGALNGLGYVGRQIGRCRDIVLNYGQDPRYVGFRALREEHNLTGFDFILRDTQRIVPFDADTFYHNPMKFYVVATKCDEAKPVFFDRDTAPDIMTCISASCSMPCICRKTMIDGEAYLDGGCSSRLGLEFLDMHPEYDRAVIVLTRPLSYRKKTPSPALKKLQRRFYGAYPALLEKLSREDEIYAAERERVAALRDAGKVLLVEPMGNLDIGRMERSVDKLKEGYEIGTRDAERCLPALREWLHPAL